MDILYGLNNEQKQALLQTKGAVLVTAGAGSGKTKLLTHRIAYLIENENVNPENILAITFTNKAANEMRERVAMLLNHSNDIWISTFHSMCLRILRVYASRLEGYTSNFTVYSESDSEKALKQVIKDLGLPNEEYKHYANIISTCQNQNIDIYAYTKDKTNEKDDLIKVYEAYEKFLQTNNAMDFDHLLSKAYELLVCNKDILEFYANKFEYVFVDEFQDTNIIQYDIIKLLTSVHKNIFVVGDEDQCIYTWRGANFKNIFNFKQDFAPVKMYKLEQNYRSTKLILEKANKLIANNQERFDKVLWTSNEDGKNVETNQYYDEQSEAENVIQKIYALTQKGDYDYKDIAILMRINALTLPFEQKLLNYNIPYRIYGGFKFYERQEIKNILSYLRLYVNPKDDVSLMRIINFPKRGIGDTAIKKIRDYAIEHKLSMLEGLLYLYDHKQDDSALYSKIESFVRIFLKVKENYEKLSLDEFTKLLIEDFEIKTAYLEQNEDNIEKLMNIDMLVNSIQQFVYANGNCTLTEYLESVTLESDIDYIGTDNTITISTIHSVKGLEFKVVFIVGVEEGIFPISRSFYSEKEMEEERRLMYVAITRAKERLFVSYAQTRYLHGNRSRTIASKFLEEADLLVKTSPISYNNTRYNNFGYEHSSYDYDSDYSYHSYDRFNSNKMQKSTLHNTIQSNGYVSAKPIENNDNKAENKDKTGFDAGVKVEHPKFGTGTVIGFVDDGVCIEIDFDGFGKKTLMFDIAPLKIIK